MQPFAAATIEFLTSMSEAELQSSIIEPLLRLQGYTHVRDTSGPNDKGKDLVAIRQEFGKTKLYAIQVKKFRFSGKHSSPRALTNALIQFRQIFGEPVIDPTINEKRFADRCVFITPYAINQSAFESALHQVKELERREISIVDGPLLADMVLQHMPNVVARSSMELQYRMAVVAETSKIKESAAFGLSTMLDLDKIYVELALKPAEEGLEELATRPAKLRKIQLIKATVNEIDALQQAWKLWDAGPPVVEEVPRPPDPLPKPRDPEHVYWKVVDRLRRELESERPRTLNRVFAVNLDPLITRIKTVAEAYMRDYLTIGAESSTNATCTEIARRGMLLGRHLARVKACELVRNFWPDLTEQPSSGTVRDPRRLNSTAILKIDLCTFVTGPPGAGKTTLLRRLSQRMAQSSVGRLPILVYLADLQAVNDYDVLRYTLRQMDAQGRTITEAELSAQLLRGGYRAFFDGLDEAGANADYLLRCIRSFSEAFPLCPVVITSRDTLREKVWSDALHIRLAALSDDQLESIVGKWFTSEPSKRTRMLEWLTANSKMRQAARTPIIAALLCSLVQANADMPSTEVELYEQRFELLLGRWEQAKGIRPLPADLRKVYWHFMMNLAADIHTREVRAIAYGEVVTLAAGYFSKQFHRTPEALVKDCIHRGLLESEGLGGVSFGHLTYQEFVVARWLAHHNRIGFIVEKLANKWWNKALEIYCAIKGDISALIEEGPRSMSDLQRLAELVEFAPLTPPSSIGKAEVRFRSAILSRSKTLSGKQPN